MHAAFQELLAIRDGEPVDAMAATHAAHCPECGGALALLAALKSELRRLPDYEPPASAWDAIRSQSLRSQPRRSRRWPLAAVAASLALALWLRPGFHHSPLVTPGDMAASPTQPPGAGENGGLSVLMQRSQRLEAALGVLPRRPRVERASTSVMIDELQDRIQWVDEQLSTPTDQPGADAERLWSARVALMNSLVHVRYAQAAGTADLPDTLTHLGAI